MQSLEVPYAKTLTRAMPLATRHLIKCVPASDQQGGLPKLCQAIGQIHRDRGFADAPLLVQDGDFHSTRLSFTRHKCYICKAESYTQVLQSVVRM